MSKQNQNRKRYSVISKKGLIYTLSIFGILVLLLSGLYAYVYVNTPSHIRKPTYQHYHFRTQILVDGKAVDFSEEKFQEETDTSQTCSAAVGGIPIDFHDDMDQMTHVHWSGMTGGEFLKYYGWNFIGGTNNLLGRRYDNGIIPSPVNIYGDLLPNLPESPNYYVYIGDKGSYQEKNWNDFLSQDLEKFFGKESNIGHSEEVTHNSALNWFFPTASAHGGAIDEHPSDKSEEELTRINNLVGNVVIFVQTEKPTQEQVKARFNNLVELHDSTCGE